MKEYNMATMQVKVAAKLVTGFNQSKTQRALVEAFLGNHQQVTWPAIFLLDLPGQFVLFKDHKNESAVGYVSNTNS